MVNTRDFPQDAPAGPGLAQGTPYTETMIMNLTRTGMMFALLGALATTATPADVAALTRCIDYVVEHL